MTSIITRYRTVPVVALAFLLCLPLNATADPMDEPAIDISVGRHNSVCYLVRGGSTGVLGGTFSPVRAECTQTGYTFLDFEFIDVSNAMSHTCYRLSDGRLLCGDTSGGQGSHLLQLQTTGDLVDFAATNWETCVLRIDMIVTCYRENGGVWTHSFPGAISLYAGDRFICATTGAGLDCVYRDTDGDQTWSVAGASQVTVYNPDDVPYYQAACTINAQSDVLCRNEWGEYLAYEGHDAVLLPEDAGTGDRLCFQRAGGDVLCQSRGGLYVAAHWPDAVALSQAHETICMLSDDGRIHCKGGMTFSYV